MTGQDVVALALVGLAVAYVVRKFWHTVGGRAGCNCSQASGTSNACGGSEKTAKPLPFVALSGVGLPNQKEDPDQS